MLDELLSLLRTSSLVQRPQIVELITYGRVGFRVKIRAWVAGELTLQIWLNHNDHHTRYSYQLLHRDRVILRWDNAPHHPDVGVNFPHHFHNEAGELKASPLTGEPIADVTWVLIAIAGYL